MTLQLTNGSLYGANEGRADECCPLGEIMHMTLIQLTVYVSYAQSHKAMFKLHLSSDLFWFLDIEAF